MTVNAYPARNEYVSSAGQSVFNYTFKIYTNLDLNVYITPAGSTADDSTDLTTGYTVDPVGIGSADGGFITFNTPTNAGDRVTIVSGMAYNRTVDYQNSGDFLPDTVNADIDRTVSLEKQTEDYATRTPSYQESQQNASEQTLAAPTAGGYWRDNAEGTGVEKVTYPYNIVEDTVTLTSGQTAAVFTVQVEGASVVVNGTNVDSGRLKEGYDYTTSGNTVTLARSYPSGTKLTVSFNDGGSVPGYRIISGVLRSGIAAEVKGCTLTNTDNGLNGRLITVTLDSNASSPSSLSLVASASGPGGAPYLCGTGEQTSQTEIAYNVYKPDGTLLDPLLFDTSFIIIDLGA